MILLFATSSYEKNLVLQYDPLEKNRCDISIITSIMFIDTSYSL